uniref:RNA-directed DNA polymerase n=1 Tax=Strongyloides venezuelensis TaxID=75913 RepID=A0A0K0FD60_STRVS
MLEKDEKKDWKRKVKPGEVVENINQCVIVRREGKSSRLCYSCVHVNKFIKLVDMLALPNIKQILLESEIQTLSIWDINAAFNRLILSDECKKYCCINTLYGVYQSNVLVFGLNCAPANTRCNIYERFVEYRAVENSSREIETNVKHALSLPKWKMDPMLEIKTLKTVKNLKSILAKFQYYAQFIPSLTTLVDDLHLFTTRKSVIEDLIKKNFEKLKIGITKSIALQVIRPGRREINKVVDASNNAMAYLVQCEYENAFRVTCCSKQKELQSVLDEAPIVVRNTTQCILSKIIPYDLTFRTIDTDKNIISEMVGANYGNYHSLDELVRAYVSDKDIQILMDIKENGWSELKQKKIDPVFRDHAKMFVVGKELVFVKGKIVIPKSLTDKVMKQFHENHQSANAMLKIARKFFLFSEMYSMIKNKYDSCSLCIANRRNKRLAVHFWPTSEYSRERYHVDVGELDRKKFLGNELINKYTELFNYYGKPLILVSDNALAFASEQTLSFLEAHKAHAVFSISNISISNGYGERCIGLVKSQLKKELSKSKTFDTALQGAQLTLNSRITLNNKSAMELFYGYNEKV